MSISTRFLLHILAISFLSIFALGLTTFWNANRLLEQANKDLQLNETMVIQDYLDRHAQMMARRIESRLQQSILATQVLQQEMALVLDRPAIATAIGDALENTSAFGDNLQPGPEKDWHEGGSKEHGRVATVFKHELSDSKTVRPDISAHMQQTQIANILLPALASSHQVNGTAYYLIGPYESHYLRSSPFVAYGKKFAENYPEHQKYNYYDYFFLASLSTGRNQLFKIQSRSNPMPFSNSTTKKPWFSRTPTLMLVDVDCV